MDIRLADSTEQALRILNDQIDALNRRKPVAPPTYWGAPVSPFTGAGPTTALSVSTDYRVATVSVTDPGYPYRLAVRAGIQIQGLSTTQPAGVSHALSVRVDSATPGSPSDTPSSGTVGANFVGQMGGVAGAFTHAKLDREPATVWTGAHTVDLFIKMGAQGGATVSIPLSGRTDFYFEVRVVPAST